MTDANAVELGRRLAETMPPAAIGAALRETVGSALLELIYSTDLETSRRAFEIWASLNPSNN